MKSKLARIIKEISSSEKFVYSPEKMGIELSSEESGYNPFEECSYTPEIIAIEFARFKEVRLGVKVSYFRNNKRTKPEAWRYFERLSEILNDWKEKDMYVDLWKYLDLHLKRVGKGKKIYPSQLILEYSHELVFGRGSMNPTYIGFVKTTAYDEEQYYSVELKRLSNEREVTELEILQEESDFHDLCPNCLSVFPNWFVKKYIRIYREKLEGK